MAERRTDTGRRRSIVVPIVALVILSVFVAIAALFAVTFSGPPERPAPQPIASIAALLRGGSPPPAMAAWQLRVTDSPTPPVPHRWEERDPVLSRALARALGVGEERAMVYRNPHRETPNDSIGLPFVAGVKVGDHWRIAYTPPPPFLTRWHLSTLGVMIAVLAGLSGLGWLIARAISRPLRELARAAMRARAGAPLAPVPVSGPREVAELARALRTMHTRLATHAEGRTAMLAAIAHDLGTPLSRLAFWVEQLPEPARGRAVADIDEMRAMIAAAIGFARDETQAHAETRIDLGSLIDSLVEDMAATGMAVMAMPGPRAIVRGDVTALRRMVANLIDNAIRYGEAARVAWMVAQGDVRITIDDDGPGIDPHQAERLFEPFTRGDPSRNRDTGGSGLGLASVRAIAQRHGGDATLGNREEGGARATVTLPLDD